MTHHEWMLLISTLSGGMLGTLITMRRIFLANERERPDMASIGYLLIIDTILALIFVFMHYQTDAQINCIAAVHIAASAPLVAAIFMGPSEKRSAKKTPIKK